MGLEWKPYLNDRIIADHPGGFFIIKPKESSASVQPLFCPICDIMMRSLYDEDSYHKFGCCDKCAARWVYPDMTRWKSGWRPSSESLKQNEQ
jgi:hypothetical protein